MCACVCVCVRVCIRVCVCVCVWSTGLSRFTGGPSHGTTLSLSLSLSLIFTSRQVAGLQRKEPTRIDLSSWGHDSSSRREGKRGELGVGRKKEGGGEEEEGAGVGRY